MTGWTGFFRETTRRPDRKVPAADAAGSLPAQPEKFVTASGSVNGIDVEKRRTLWGTLKARGMTFGDGTHLVPGAGVSWFGRIFRYFELQAFMESCDFVKQQADGTVYIDPRRANNTLVQLTQPATFAFPVGYDDGSAEPGLLNPSDIEVLAYGKFRRARVQPHTVWVQHAGFQMGVPGEDGVIDPTVTFAGALVPENATVPTSNGGVTAFTAVHVNNPLITATIPWRITGFAHWTG